MYSKLDGRLSEWLDVELSKRCVARGKTFMQISGGNSIDSLICPLPYHHANRLSVDFHLHPMILFIHHQRDRERTKMFKTRLTELLGVEYPIIGGAMAYLSTAELAAAIRNRLGEISASIGALALGAALGRAPRDRPEPASSSFQAANSISAAARVSGVTTSSSLAETMGIRDLISVRL